MKGTNDLSIDIIIICFVIQDLFLKVGFTRNEKDAWLFDVHKFVFCVMIFYITFRNLKICLIEIYIFIKNCLTLNFFSLKVIV
jgi:hypothetical protein